MGEEVGEERLEGVGRCREEGAQGAGPHGFRCHRGQVRRRQGLVCQGQILALTGSLMPPREVFGKLVFVKAKPAKLVVKSYCGAALKEEHLRAAAPLHLRSAGRLCGIEWETRCCCM